jgi:LmbE family N-acetylglucosaminyl deacetylase
MAANEPGQPPLNGQPWTRDLAVPAVALAVGAHPDDVEFGCGATLAKWAAAGCLVHHVVCTDGSKGTWDADADTAELARQREVEQREAARRLAGDRAGEVRFLRHVDGELRADHDSVAEVVRAIRELRPTVVLGHDPWKRYRLHPDHRAAGTIVCDAIVAARDPHFLRHIGPSHHRPDALLLWEADEAHHVEDVFGWVEAKLDALHAHASQFESTMGAVSAADLQAFDQRIISRLSDLGAPHRLEAAEVFAIITDL